VAEPAASLGASGQQSAGEHADACAGAPAHAAPRIAVVGMSVRSTCGVRDHASVLGEALAQEGVQASMHWLQRGEQSLPAARREIRAWARTLSRELESSPPAAVLLHYSVFSYSYRGLPLFVRSTLAALHRSRAPLLAFMHELAYPWRYSGLRGDVWALTQRAALVDVMRASRAVVVTAESRARWLASRRWLPRREVRVAPVFSNLPDPTRAAPAARTGHTIGIFGYSYEGAAVALVLDALALLRERDGEVRLRLLGAPGRSSSSGEAWVEAARARGLADALAFSGALPAQELSDALGACEVLLLPDTAGPSSRKGTLAAALSSGRPLVALHGRNAWAALIDAQAACVVAPTPHELARALGVLLGEEDRRERLGVRGRAFAEREMGVRRSARTVTSLLAQLHAGARAETVGARPPR